jgi:3-hydroxyisobutyrate dehydrogenase-like beta-hydroxyacid dehydrogenase
MTFIDIIVTMLPNSPHVKDVVLGQDGIIEAARPGMIVIDMSSIAPLVSREIAERLAEKAGVAPELVFNAIRGGLAGSTVLDAKAPLVMDRKFNPGFRINLHIEDLGNVLETAHEIRVPLPLTAAVMEMMQALKVDGLGGEDHCSLVKYYEKLAKVEVAR